MSPEGNGDTSMENNEEEGGDEQRASYEPTDGLGRVISDAKRDCETQIEKLKLEAMLNDHKTLLYPNCADCAYGSTKLGTTLELLKWKAETGCTDSGFEKLLKLMKPKFPKDNKLPETTRDPKLVGYNPLKRLEIAKITSLVDASRVMYRGSQGIEILPGPENRGL